MKAIILFAMNPSLSFIIPNYNHAQFLPTQLNAVLSQSHPAKEIIVVDDASTDRSVEVVEEFGKEYPQIRLLRLARNQGPCVAVNEGIALATGEYLGLGSADDRILPSFFETAIYFVEKYPHAGLFCSKVCFFDDGNPNVLVDEKNWIELDEPKVFSPAETLHLFRTTNFRISSPSSIYKRSSLIKHNGYRDGMKMLADWFLNCEIALHDGFIYVPKPFASQRVGTTSKNYSASFYHDKKKKEAVYEEMFQFIFESSDRQLYQKSLIAYQLGMDGLKYLLKRPKYWSFIPPLLLKKARMLC